MTSFLPLKEGEVVYDEYDKLCRTDTVQLTSREILLYKHAWSLTYEERGKLSRYFLLKSSYARFLEERFIDRGGYERLCISPICSSNGEELRQELTLRVNYHDTNIWKIENSENKEETNLLISVRVNIPNNLWNCLVRKSWKLTEEEEDKYASL